MSYKDKSDKDLFDELLGLNNNTKDLAAAMEAANAMKREIEAELISRSTADNAPRSGNGYSVRWNAGRASTQYDADGIYAAMDESQRQIAFTMKPVFDKTVFAAMVKSGRLTGFDSFVTIVPANGRWEVKQS